MTDRTGPMAAAIDQLHHAIDQLEKLAATEAERAELDILRRAALRLSKGGQIVRKPPIARRPTLKQFEPARFQRLLELAGPENGAELLARLSEDLADTRRKTDQGARTQDWALLRAASHVLISLAGSVGALSLQSLAEQLNLVANGHDLARLSPLVPETLDELDALIAIVATTSAPQAEPK